MDNTAKVRTNPHKVMYSLVPDPLNLTVKRFLNLLNRAGTKNKIQGWKSHKMV